MNRLNKLGIYIACFLLVVLIVGCDSDLEQDVLPENDTDIEEEIITAEDEIKEYLPMDFVYCSNSGDWYTLMTLNEDLTYEGHYYCSQPGMSDVDYFGAIFECDFSGEFGEVEKETDYKYSLTLETINVHTAQEENIIDDVLHAGVPPRGLEDSKYFELYLPVTSMDDVPEINNSVPWDKYSLVSSTWNPNKHSWTDTIGCYELYNKESRFLFVSNSNENTIPCTDGVLSIIDITTGEAHSPFCDKVKAIKPENRRIIITPHFKVEPYGYTLDNQCR